MPSSHPCLAATVSAREGQEHPHTPCGPQAGSITVAWRLVSLAAARAPTCWVRVCVSAHAQVHAPWGCGLAQRCGWAGEPQGQPQASAQGALRSGRHTGPSQENDLSVVPSEQEDRGRSVPSSTLQSGHSHRVPVPSLWADVFKQKFGDQGQAPHGEPGL